MEPFFRVIEHTGIVQRKIASQMGVSPFTFTRTKRGTQPMTNEFRQRATEALTALGIRKADGTAYQLHDLFFLPDVVTVVTESDNIVSGRAA